MYTFWDNDEQLTLRPEGTAGCVRAAIEHGWIYNNEQTFYGTWDQCSAMSVHQKRSLPSISIKQVWKYLVFQP